MIDNIKLSADGKCVIVQYWSDDKLLEVKVSKDNLKPLVCGNIMKGCCGSDEWKPFRG